MRTDHFKVCLVFYSTTLLIPEFLHGGMWKNFIQEYQHSLTGSDTENQ